MMTPLYIVLVRLSAKSSFFVESREQTRGWILHQNTDICMHCLAQDALLIAAFMSKDWDSVSQKIYDEAQETKQLLASDGSEGIELEQSMARARSPASQEEAAD